MTPIPLNAFQQVMRLWDQVHPYNALHAATITRPQSLAALNTAWQATLQSLRLGHVEITGTRYTHTTAQPSDAAFTVAESSADTLGALLTAQLEQRFELADHAPFRAFTATIADRQILGLTYHHWAADSHSIRRLLRQWFARLFDPAAIDDRPFPVATNGLWHHFGPHAAGWPLDHAVGSLLRYVTRFARARRCSQSMGDCNQRVTTHALPPGVIQSVARKAKRLGVTVNDVLSAALLQTIDRFGVHERSPGRDELAIGTVADLRGGGEKPLTNFGMFLGFTTTVARPADLLDFDQLLRRVASQNRHHKKSLGPQTSLLRMGVALAESKISTPRDWANGYRSRMPLAASISNVNLNRDWPATYHPAIIADYFRVTPTGPMIPLLFTPTTLGEGMNFCLTANVDHIDAARQAQIANDLSARILAFIR